MNILSSGNTQQIFFLCFFPPLNGRHKSCRRQDVLSFCKWFSNWLLHGSCTANIYGSLLRRDSLLRLQLTRVVLTLDSLGTSTHFGLIWNTDFDMIEPSRRGVQQGCIHERMSHKEKISFIYIYNMLLNAKGTENCIKVRQYDSVLNQLPNTSPLSTRTRSKMKKRKDTCVVGWSITSHRPSN